MSRLREGTNKVKLPPYGTRSPPSESVRPESRASILMQDNDLDWLTHRHLARLQLAHLMNTVRGAGNRDRKRAVEEVLSDLGMLFDDSRQAVSSFDLNGRYNTIVLDPRHHVGLDFDGDWILALSVETSKGILEELKRANAEWQIRFDDWSRGSGQDPLPIRQIDYNIISITSPTYEVLITKYSGGGNPLDGAQIVRDNEELRCVVSTEDGHIQVFPNPRTTSSSTSHSTSFTITQKYRHLPPFPPSPTTRPISQRPNPLLVGLFSDARLDSREEEEESARQDLRFQRYETLAGLAREIGAELYWVPEGRTRAQQEMKMRALEAKKGTRMREERQLLEVEAEKLAQDKNLEDEKSTGSKIKSRKGGRVTGAGVMDVGVNVKSDEQEQSEGTIKEGAEKSAVSEGAKRRRKLLQLLAMDDTEGERLDERDVIQAEISSERGESWLPSATALSDESTLALRAKADQAWAEQQDEGDAAFPK